MAVAFVAQAVTIGLTIIPFGLFATPMVEEFGLSIASVQVGLGLFIVVLTGTSAGIGPLLDRYSIRLFMALGSILMALCFWGMSLAHHPWQLALLFSGGTALGVSLAGPLAATTVIAKWFDEKRGLAVGIAAMGPPTGGLLLTPLAGWLLAEFGWRETLQVFAVISLLLTPLAWLVVKSTPEEVGQTVDGLTPMDPIAKAHASPAPLNLRKIIRSRNFWSLALAMGIVFGIGGGWNANAPRFGEDLGYSGQYMSSLIGIAAGLGIPSTLLFGLLADRFDNRRLLWWAIGGQALAFLLLWTQSPGIIFTGAILLFGFFGGGLLPVYASFIGRLFGPAAFGSVMGLAGVVGLPFGASAPILAGAIRDQSGSYEDALLCFAVAFLMSTVVLRWIRPATS